MLYVNTNAIADALGVAPGTVATWAREGVFPGARIARGRWAIPTHEAEAFVKERLSSQERGDDGVESG